MKSITLLALIAGTAPAPPALAQNSDATRSARNDTPDPARRDDIVVTGRNFVVADSTTATKSDAPILSTPQAISVVDSDFIDTLNLRTVAEALNYTSGVRSQAFGSDTRIDYYQLRGFANSNFFKDGLVLYNSGAFLSWTTPAEGIERLEVLKGPSSVLYGSGSAGGLVNIVSKAPNRRTIANIEAGIDEYGSAYGSADLGGAISDTLAVRVNGLVRRGDTQVELAEDNRTYGSVALGWTPTSDTSLTLRGSYTRDRSQRPTGFVPYAGFVTPLGDGRKIPIDLFVSDPSVDRYDRDQYEVGYTFETKLGENLRFVSNGRYAEIDLTYAGLFGQFTGNPVLAGGRYYLNRGNSRQDAWLDNVTIDNRLSGTIRTGALVHDLTAGIDYSFSRTASSQRQGTAPRLDIFAPVYNVALPALGVPSTTRQKLDQTGLYVQDRITLGGLVALLSARHDWIGITSTSATGAVTRGDPDKTTYRAGLSYVTPVGLAPYVSYATSFTPVIGAEAATGQYYRPETGEAWEAGIKYEARGFPLIASASLFSIERDGILVSNPVAGFPTNQSQLGLVRSRGGEVEVQARPMSTLNITAALTAFKTENREGAAATLGKAPTGTPGFSASAFIDYTLPAGSFLPGFGLGSGIRHVGRSWADTANTLAVPSATVFDAAIHYDLGAVRLAGNVSNLFDKKYVGACPSAGTCYAANLRRATISLAYRFGDNR
ncbi:TonB-dependent siderophore receptor [Sphingomonas sp. RRHST34]|uniref:TonB-dependent siderophore receptor n=1 Tax=Sphingomonas citri TaxID=2862499 RepID=A0ABS7BU78_9SPHN|nr:TonB-dependent siderophore receptor [Sphingomonas citri]MBW6533155.1 TonB-dependent siderophore receptor [Sphingomonas citri]